MKRICQACFTELVEGETDYCTFCMTEEPDPEMFTGLFSFKGRIGRLTYLIWSLIAMVVSLPFLSALQYADLRETETLSAVLVGVPAGIFFAIIWFAGVALTVKRLHDFNLSGWFIILFSFIPIGNIIIMVIPSSPGPNNFGRGPQDIQIFGWHPIHV